MFIESNNFTYIRLVGGRGPYEGRVEVYYGHWGTVCHDYFDINDAHVVCKELGYPEAVRYYRSSYFGQGSGPIWLDDLACMGTETSLHYCSHNGVGNHDCVHHKDVGVVCSGKAFFVIYLIHTYDSHIVLTFVVCGGLSNPVNGGVSNTVAGVGDTVTYFCNYGYELIGDTTVTCQASGNWSGSPPICRG